MENVWENDQIPELLLILGPKVAQNMASEAHILNTSKVLEMWSNTDRKSVNILPKMAQKFGLWGPYCTHLLK